MRNLLIITLLFLSSLSFGNDTLNVHVISVNQTIDQEFEVNFKSGS